MSHRGSIGKLALIAAMTFGTAAASQAQDGPPRGGPPGGGPGAPGGPGRTPPPHMAPMVARTVAPALEASLDVTVPGGSYGPVGSLKLEYSGLSKTEGGSPPLSWTAGPQGTKSYAVIMQDLPADGAQPAYLHWAMYDIPAGTKTLPPHIPVGASVAAVKGATQLDNSQNKPGYLPPGPPRVSIPVSLAGGENELNVYTIQVFALDQVLGPVTNFEGLVDAMKGKVLAYGAEHIILQIGKRAAGPGGPGQPPPP